jgi:hypothetical protein
LVVIIVAFAAGVGGLEATATLAASPPAAQLVRTRGDGLKFTAQWGPGIAAFYLYIVRRKNEQIYDLPGTCTPAMSDMNWDGLQWDQIECVISQATHVTLRFSVSPRYPRHEPNQVQLVSSSDSVYVSATGP